MKLYRHAICADCGNELRHKKDCVRFKEVGKAGEVIVVRCLICADKRRMKRWKEKKV